MLLYVYAYVAYNADKFVEDKSVRHCPALRLFSPLISVHSSKRLQYDRHERL